MQWHGAAAWQALLQRFFERPDELIFGLETANQALGRFESAVEAVCAEVDADAGALCIVTHGTVMSLYVGRQRNEPPYSIWSRLLMPDYVELEYVVTS
jgi:broad specificity phosphatase PhoE